MNLIETKIFGLPIYRAQVKSPVAIEVPTAYKMNQGEKLYLQDDGSGLKWVQVRGGHVQELANPVPMWVTLGSRVPFVSRKLVLK